MIELRPAIEIALPLLAFACGVAAAYFWLTSSRISVSPTYESVGLIEPADEAQWVQNQWIAGLLKANQKTGRLNGYAAQLTAASVLFSALSALVSAWPF